MKRLSLVSLPRVGFLIAAGLVTAPRLPLLAQQPINYMADGYDKNSADYKALQLEQARDSWIDQKAKLPSYTRTFDLSALPHYTPEVEVTGTLRIWGEQYLGRSNLGQYWADGFRKFHPNVKIEYFTPVAGVGWPGLYLKLADLAVATTPKFYELQAYERVMTYHPTQIVACTGSYDVSGWSNPYVILVNEASPLTHITYKQLDGIFGSRREGGWEGTAWIPEHARGSDQDIRKWGQLGFSGEWANQTINPYGFSTRYDASMGFSNRVLHGSDKWNGDLRAFGNIRKADGTFFIEAEQIMDALAQDKNGIGWNLYRGPRKGLRALLVSKTDHGPFIPLTMETVQNRTYPMINDEYFFVNVKPGTKMDPRVREFIRYALSQEGQGEVERDGKYLPLPAATVEEGRAKAK